jgi:hypothetical protein
VVVTGWLAGVWTVVYYGALGPLGVLAVAGGWFW